MKKENSQNNIYNLISGYDIEDIEEDKFTSTYLRDEGYQIGRGSFSTKEESDSEEFIIRASGPREFVSRSVVLQKDIAERLDNISEDNLQYSKKAIINKLLDEALKKYRY